MTKVTRASLFAGICAVPHSANALCDPAPSAGLSAIESSWHGTLAYRDLQPPIKRVTLLTRFCIAAASPTEFSLHYIFDDGPKKAVHSYDRPKGAVL